MKYLAGLLLLLSGCAVQPTLTGNETPQDAIAADKAGDHEKALAIFKQLADRGDARAMTTVGTKYYTGTDVPQDYCEARDWFLKAFQRADGDAFNNLGVMFRDGQCLPQNRKIAYTLFLTTHMKGLGSEAAQLRASQSLRREMAEQPRGDIQEALCYTGAYITEYVMSKGELTSVPQDVRPSSVNVRLKDNSWWLKSEKKQMDFACPAPWNLQ